MLDPDYQYTLFYDKVGSNPSLDEEYPTHKGSVLYETSRSYRYDALLREAELERLAKRLPQRGSATSRVVFDAGAWLVKIGCLLENYGFGRLQRSQPAAALVPVDCGCR